nr:MFS transporter [Halobacillus sp. GSS1]
MLMFTLAFLALIGVMNAVLFNVAFENILYDLSVSTSQVSWIAVGYSMGIAIGSITYGKLADHFHLKNLLTIGIILFLIGSVLGFVKQESYFIIILARLLQAFGGASFITLSMVSVRKMIRPEKRSTAFALISVGVALAIGMGPLIGGAITDLFGWPYLFVSMLISIIALGPILKVMPLEDKINEKFSFDFTGAFLLFGVIASLLLGANITVMFFILFAIFFLLFGLWISRAKKPFIHQNLFKNTKFMKAITVGFITNGAVMTNMFLIPLLLGIEYDITTSLIGLIFFIASIFSIISSLTAGKILPQQGSKKVIYTSSTIMLLSFLILGVFPDLNIILITFMILLIFIAFSAIQVGLNTLVPQTLISNETGVGLGVYNLMNNVGMALGPAAASAILEQTQSYSLNFVLIALLIIGNIILIAGFSKDK